MQVAIKLGNFNIFTGVAPIMMMYAGRRLWVAAAIILLCAVSNVYSAHFRGGTIMVRPKLGGAATEVTA